MWVRTLEGSFYPLKTTGSHGYMWSLPSPTMVKLIFSRRSNDLNPSSGCYDQGGWKLVSKNSSRDNRSNYGAREVQPGGKNSSGATYRDKIMHIIVNKG